MGAPVREADYRARCTVHRAADERACAAAYNSDPGAFPKRSGMTMNKAFTREIDVADDDEQDAPSPLPSGARNYMTPGGFGRMKAELDRLVQKERPELVATVAWAAGNGDRSENGDYIYGKKRLREIDRRIRFLVRRLDVAEVVDPAARRDEGSDQVFFGATVTVRDGSGGERTISIVGVDEIDTGRGYVSWVSPIARALINAREGDTVSLQTPGGVEDLEIVAVRYVPLATGDTVVATPVG
jgi:transcription elongation factor GreB